jgi:hypothetical protein
MANSINDAEPREWDRLNAQSLKVKGGICPPSYFGPSIKSLVDEKVESTGDSTTYYELPEGAKEIQDLIEHKGMDFAQGNVFKAAWRVGNKAGTSDLYDWKKIRWFADRKIAELERYEQEERDYEQSNNIY